MSNPNYFKFDNIQINDIWTVTSITKQMLPPKEYQTINIPTIDGEILDGVKYSPLEYTIQILVEGDTEEERDLRCGQLRDLLNTKEEKKIAFDDDKYSYGMVTSAISSTDVNDTQTLCDFTLTCFKPFFYANEYKLVDSSVDGYTSPTIEISNDGGEPTKPFISVGFTQDAHFLQVENKETGERILVGDYPKINVPSQSKSTTVLYDNCEQISTWTASEASIDGDRIGGGTVGITSDGNCICLKSLPSSGSATWKGVILRQNLSKAVDEFEVKVRFNHNSTGTNGDPTHLNLDQETITSGKTETYYKVTATSLNVRSGPGTKYSKFATVKKGYEIYNATKEKGWIKFKDVNDWGDRWAYVSGDYVETKKKTNTVTTTKENWVMAGAGALCSSPKYNNSTVICRIPAGTVVRVISSKVYTENSNPKRYWFKLATKYNGKDGYVCRGDMVKASDAYITYSEDELKKYADDKTGIIELYGMASDGSQLFKLSMNDDNKYYEYTYPLARIGQTVVYQDNTKVPPPKQSATKENGTDGKTEIKITNYLSGRLGSWNEFYGQFLLTREKVKDNYVWSLEIIKIKSGVITKTVKKANMKNSAFPTAQLSYLVLYMGTSQSSMEKCSDVAITDLRVKELNPKPETPVNTKFFSEGDILDLDFENRTAYLNEVDCNYLVDIGSRFFDIQPGVNELKFVSDDPSIVAGAVINEKWIGED